MEPDKKDTPSPEAEKQDQTQGQQEAPADALSRTPEDLEEEKAKQATADNTQDNPDEKKLSPIKKLFRKINLYILIFSLILVIVGAVTIVNFLNSQKPAPEPDITNQSLTADALKQLSNSDATVGNTSQTLTIQGNAIIAGQTLLRGALNVAGNIQAGGSITAPSITISGTSNLGTTQIDNLQVAQNTAVQGTTTLRDLNVAGTSSFSGAVTASQITVTKLILNGNSILQVPNHIAFTGPSPGRSFIGSGILGSGGSVSLNGSDTTGTINLNSGNNPIGSGCIVQVTFQKAFTNQPHVLISPVNSAAGKLDYYVERDSTKFTLCTSTSVEANQVFAFDYFVTN
ncbi:hypothetical protein KC953_01610 [Candidatus Saccharibacteria bacterium]|nr:hypothetical protein [Candidatus Saccharibacteria bacterium]